MFSTLVHIKHIGVSLFVCLLLLLSNGLKAQSIIIKFRSSDALVSPSKQVLDLASKVARSSISTQRTFITRSSGQTPQSIMNTFGLERVILLPLKKGMSVDSISTLFSLFSDVEYAQPNYMYHIDAVEIPNDSLFSEQWAHPNIGVEKAWEITKGDSSVKIGFVDTGVEWDHPDLAGQFAVNIKEDINNNGLFDAWKSTEQKNDARGKLVKGDLDGIDSDGNGFVDDIIGYDFVDQETLNFGDASIRDAIPIDENKHGTAVAGVIGAKEDNTIGVAGIAPGCRMVVLRAFDASGNAEDDDIASAIIYAADNNVKILNLSFGDIIPSLLQRDAIRYATSKGTLVFASSGNRGSNSHHYPSDFDECVSVGATTVNEDGKGDFIYSFNTHGQGMDLVAPGGNIYTTNLNGKYQVISGTSFSSPTAAAVAGLLLSKDPTLTPHSLRTILTATTHDISPVGYDNLSANGRVNAFAAVSYNGSAALKIASPHTNDGFHPGDTITINGTVAHSLFTEYSLAFAKGLNPPDNASWQTITSSSEQKIDKELGKWLTGALDDDTYTLRLEVKTTEGRSIQERVNIDVRSNAPTLTFALIDTVYINDKRALMLRAKADTLTTATFYYKEQTSALWKSRKDDRYTKEHYTLIETKDATVDVPLDIRIMLYNTTGDSVVYTSAAGIPNQAVSQTGFNQKPYTLPLGFALDSVLVSTQGELVTMSIFPPSDDFGPIGTFAFDKTKKLFTKNDSVNRSWVPRGIGNTTADGMPELLLQGGNNYILYKANANVPLLGDIVLYDTTELGSFFAMGLGDIDGDGKDEIVTKEKVQSGGSLSEVIRIRRRVGSTTELIATLLNNTFPAPQYSVNNYSKADVRFADFTGDNIDDIVILDDDGDLLVYKYDPTNPEKFVAFHTEENDAAADGSMITTGDFNGDGKQDLAYTFRPSFVENRDNEYEYPFWTLSVSLGSGNGTFTKVKSKKFAYARPSSPTRSSIGSVGDVAGNGKAQIGVSLFPDFYLFEVTPGNTLEPLWHFPLSVTSRTGLSHDFDGNGRKEFAVTAGDATYFFERDDEFTNQTASPGGLEALPRDTNEVELRWSEVTGATKYFILRAPDVQGSQYDIIDSTSLTSYHDTTVENGATYIYSIFAFDASKSIPESQAAFGVKTFVHPKPFMTNITSDGRTIRATSSQPLMKNTLEGGCIRLNGNIEATTVAVASDSVVLITLAQVLTESGDYTLQVTNERVRDRWNSPLDSAIISWKFDYNQPEEKFYITKWRFENQQLIHVTFNQQPSDNGLDIVHYSFSPYGTLLRAYRDTQDPFSIYLELNKDFQYIALGTEFMLCASGITSIANTPLSHEGDCIGTTLTEPDLANIMVYPNPAHTKDEKMTFARLTADAEVNIYTMNQRFIRRLKTTNQKGGIEWDMRDDNGALLTSGIYLYNVTGKNDNGEEVESNQAKFVIINDK